MDDGSVVRGYYEEDFRAAWARWLLAPGKAATSATAATWEGKAVAATNPVARYQIASRYQKYEGSSGGSGSPQGAKTEREKAVARADTKRGMTPGEFIAEATRLFNGTPAQ